MVVVKERSYEDITEKCFNNKYKKYYVIDVKYFCVGKKKYFVDGKRVVLDYSDKEKEIAKWLGKTFGGKIYMLPRINEPEGIQTADYLFKGEYWDLKSISGKSNQVLYHSIYKKKTQNNNFICDVSTSELDIKELKSQIDKLFSRKDTEFLQKIILKKKNYIFVYKRK